MRKHGLVSGKLNGSKQTDNKQISNNKSSGKDVQLLDGRDSVSYKR